MAEALLGAVPKDIDLKATYGLDKVPALPVVTVTADDAAAANRARLPDVTTATRTRTPAKQVPQTIDSVKTEDITAYGGWRAWLNARKN